MLLSLGESISRRRVNTREGKELFRLNDIRGSKRSRGEAGPGNRRQSLIISKACEQPFPGIAEVKIKIISKMAILQFIEGMWESSCNSVCLNVYLRCFS